MIDIPPEAQIKSTIKPGSVFYFIEEALKFSEEPHYFIVINHNPITDRVILLVCASSQIQKVKRMRRSITDTIVEVAKREYPDFTKDSIIDCNGVFERSISTLVQKLKEGDLKAKREIDISIVEKLRKATIASPLVENNIKKLLTQPG